LPVTVDVNVTLTPAVAGLSELVNDVEVAAFAATTVCASAALVEGRLAESPLYAATTLSVPAGNVEDVHCAFALTSVTLQTALPLTVNFTVPVGELPDTDAVKVTLAPAAAGLSELVNDVEVAVKVELEETLTVARVADTEGTLIVMWLVLSV